MAMTREEMQRLASYGRNGDTMLAHINPQEAALLKSRGGAGTINPKTGLPEFYGTWQINYMDSLKGVRQEPKQYEYGGGLNIREIVKEPFDRKFADVTYGGMGSQQITGYTLPTEGKTFADIPLVSKYDPQGNFNYLTLEPGKYLTPDPSRPNIQSVPRLDASGKVVDWGIVDTDNLDNGSFGSMVRELATDLGPILQAVLAYYMPVITSSLAPSLVSAGITDAITQKAVANAIASTVVQVAQGKDIGDALQSSVVTAATSTGSMDVARQVNDVIGNQAVTDAILSAGSSAAQTALAGGSQSDIEQSVIGGILGSTVASVTDNSVLGSAAANAVTGGIASAVDTLAIGSAGAAGQAEATRIETERAKSAQTKVSEIIADELSKVGIAGALPAAETGVYARALENANQKLIRVVKDAANDADYLKKLPELEDALTKSGTSIGKVLGTGISLGTYTPELNANEDAELKTRLKDAKIEITFSPLTPTDVNSLPPVVNVDLINNPELILPNTEEYIDPRLIDIVSPPSIEPEVIPGTAPEIRPIITPSPNTNPSPGTSPTPGTEPIYDPNVSPNTSPNAQPSTNTAPLSEPALNPLGQPIPATNLNPNVSPPGVSTPYSPFVLPFDGGNAPTDTSGTPIDETATDETATEETPTDETDTVDETSTVITAGKTPEEIARREEIRERARKKRRAARRAAIAASKVTPQTSVLPEVLNTQFNAMPSSLTSLRGAGEIESTETGKKRKNVWNEESLRLKDALGL